MLKVNIINIINIILINNIITKLNIKLIIQT